MRHSEKDRIKKGIYSYRHVEKFLEKIGQVPPKKNDIVVYMEPGDTKGYYIIEPTGFMMFQLWRVLV